MGWRGCNIILKELLPLKKQFTVVSIDFFYNYLDIFELSQDGPSFAI